MFWTLYNILFPIAYVLMLPHFLFRMWRRGGYRKGFLQRFGIYGNELQARLRQRSRIWIHAVSVGELHVAFRFAEEVRKCRPDAAFVFTTNTSTGHRMAEGRMRAEDVLLYFPVDVPWILRRVLRAIRPRALLLTECELWPNLIRMSSKAGIPVVLLNGRMSTRSYRGYRYLRALVERAFAHVDLFLMQETQDAERVLALGAPRDRVRVTGSVKYDATQTDSTASPGVRELLSCVKAGPETPVWVCGSTWPGEEDLLLGMFLRLRVVFPGLRLVLVPRHAERGGEVERILRRMGVAYLKRSEVRSQGGAESARQPAEVLLVDTTGELPLFYACATVVFVGKSLTQHGGQNPLEPAGLGKAVVVGPNMENFEGIMRDLLAAEAVVQVQDAAGLEQALMELFTRSDRREQLGRAAQALIGKKRGVVQRSVQEILPLISAPI